MPLPPPQVPTPQVPAPIIATPSPAAAPAPNVIQPHAFQVPRTAEGARWLQEIGRQISSQLDNVRSRRTSLAKQYELSNGANRAGLEQQLRILDQRIAQLELDLGEVGALKTQMPPTFTTQAPWLDFGPKVAAIPGMLPFVLAFFVLVPVSRWMWRRSSRPAPPPGWSEAAARLERVEQAMDTIAIEVERVSEGQRYISKMMMQRAGESAHSNSSVQGAPEMNGAQPLPALGAGSPEPMVVQPREEVRVRRS